MSESPEHEFLKTTFTQVLDRFSRLDLYGFKEIERKRFDLSCLLERDWSRPLVGQVLWKNSAGVEKDIRTLITDRDSEIRVYLARGTIQHQVAFEDVLGEYRRSRRFEDLFKLKTFWIPPDFDADDEKQRDVVGNIMQARVVEDLLFNVVFGNLTAESMAVFLASSGIPGLNLAVLYMIATFPFQNIATLARQVAVSEGPVREKLSLLHGGGFITTPRGALDYRCTTRGRVLLDLAARLFRELRTKKLTPELKYVLTKLGCPVPRRATNRPAGEYPRQAYDVLFATIIHAADDWGLNFVEIQFEPFSVRRSRGPAA